MWPVLLITAYCALVGVASLVGGWLPTLMRLTHTRMQVMMSFVGGLMMGVAILHLLPHSVVETGSLDRGAWSCVCGLLAMFLAIRIFQVHGHDPHANATCHVHDLHGSPGKEHDSACLMEPVAHAHGLSWFGLFLGLALHTLIDGIALAASVAASSDEGMGFGLIGLGTFLAVLLHKPLDALAIATMMLGGGWSARWRGATNVLFALMCPLGALAFFFGVRTFEGAAHTVVGCALGFSAGAFLCISLADVLPEVQFHHHDRLKLSVTLLLGVLLAWCIGFVEPEQAHGEAAGAHAGQLWEGGGLGH